MKISIQFIVNLTLRMRPRVQVPFNSQAASRQAPRLAIQSVRCGRQPAHRLHLRNPMSVKPVGWIHYYRGLVIGVGLISTLSMQSALSWKPVEMCEIASLKVSSTIYAHLVQVFILSSASCKNINNFPRRMSSAKDRVA